MIELTFQRKSLPPSNKTGNQIVIISRLIVEIDIGKTGRSTNVIVRDHTAINLIAGYCGQRHWLRHDFSENAHKRSDIIIRFLLL